MSPWRTGSQSAAWPRADRGLLDLTGQRLSGVQAHIKTDGSLKREFCFLYRQPNSQKFGPSRISDWFADIKMYACSSPSRTSTQSSLDSIQTVPVQLLDARFVDSHKLRPRLDEIFQNQDYELKLCGGQWHILGAPRLTKQHKASLLL
ncbi:hypothetical protein PV04_09488 [Phialophora macrospora]|uniref:Uncharacterized protein n=1 Tax=Phialophora macrospora TaxID=1851006 RepID=A0A0D2F999_9EURO|nr:hypothetical protein PV04_09488 [Phialophora macrospora]